VGKSVSEMESELEETKEESISSELLNETGGIQIKSGSGRIYCLTIAGQIEGHVSLPPSVKSTRYEQILPKLVEVEEDEDITGLLLLLNTMGGDVEAGLAIAEMISGMSKPTVSLVLGGGHSIGIPLAVSTNRSFIVKSATMTVHPVRTNGLVIGVTQSFDYFKKMQQRINRFIVENSGVEESVFTKLMHETGKLADDVGTVLDGEEAVKVGLIDELGGLKDALKYLNEQKKA